MPPIPRGPIRPEELVSINESIIRGDVNVAFPGKLRNSGSAVIDGMFAATQRFRALIGLRERLYDIAPSVLLGQELRAEVRYLDGSPLRIADLVTNQQIVRPWTVCPRESGLGRSAP
jgi:fructose-1,6-bisphosphatase/inositol monophosphatase family enzyme